ncbi:FecR domain-containing protein [Oryzifoliimicrobium ureilyticus]|uniref:FecR domain-containing protein n=1 Tax=Oryzifoliimicrobium ureilyticus TaxID=3113724 RepID=UPI003076399D
MKYRCGGIVLLLLAVTSATPAEADPIQRISSPSGSVIDRKSGEEVRFVDLSDWRNVELHQDLLGGDTLRTNATGQLAILFADHTQVRLGRNSSLQVKQMASSGDTILNLQSGSMWARAQRGGSGLTVETPAAAAAIRGTDWTLTVKGDQTSLIVLEGHVEFKNEHGSVQVAQGEAAVATIGQAPRKLIIVAPDDHEQMLFYLTLRSGFTFMPASPLPIQEMRRERARLGALPETARSTEDWITLAEVQLTFDGKDAALQSLRIALSRPLSSRQKARIALIEALVAGARKNYGEAAKLFQKAQAGLDSRRRSIAAYGAYYARSLADPNRQEKPPSHVTGPYASVMKAYTSGFLQDIPAAIKTIKDAEARYPSDATLPALRSMLAQLINDRVQMREAIDRSLSLDPDEPNALQARARYKSDFQGDLNGALSDLNRSIAIAPGDAMSWNDLGLLQAERGASREAEAALRRSVELDPDDPIGHANLAVFLLDQSRVKEAKQEIDKALEADPAFAVALLARGRYYLQTDQTEKAVDDLLAAATANPAYSQAQLLLAAAHYENKDREPSNQALDNADRLDKNDPVISSFRTALAIDSYDADGAIRNAQEYLRRTRARGGNYTSLGANQDAGSTLNNAFRLQGLDAWGQYYGDVVFDPFSGSSYIDQSLRGNVNPLANSFLYGDSVINNRQNSASFSSLIQGLMFDPHMISGRSRSANLLRQPFLEGSLGVGTTLVGSKAGLIGEAEIQGFSNTPVPVSGYANFRWEKTPDTSREFDRGLGALDVDSNTKILGGNAYLTATVSPDDRVVGYINHSDSKFDFNIPVPGVVPFAGVIYGLDNKFTTAGLGWSHTFGYRDVVNAAVFYSALDTTLDQTVALPAAIGAQANVRQQSYVAAVNHTLGDDDLTWRYGIEGGIIHDKSISSSSIVGIPVGTTTTEGDETYGRAYVDLLHEITPDLKAEYGLFGTLLQGDVTDFTRLEPRIGLGWSPVSGHWLRVGYIRQGTDTGTPTLGPIGILGMQPNEFGIGVEGYSDTFSARWDAEWNDWLFTTVDYQHQRFRDLSINDIIIRSSFESRKAEADRVSFTTNVALSHGFGLSATYALTASDDRDPASATFGRDIVFLPKNSAQVALTWVNEANIRATVAANSVGKRYGDVGGQKLDDYWTLDASLIWEPLDKRFALEAAAYNLLDEKFKVSSDFNGWGRVFKGTLKVRF